MAQTALSVTRNFALEASVKAHLIATALPETCPGLCWTPPPRGLDFVKIFTFYLAPEKRPDRAMAPCPACSPGAPKYYHGVLVWFPLEQVYRCIGRECAAHFIGHKQALTAEREFKARTEHNRNYAFAFDNMGNVPAMILHMRALLHICIHAEVLLRGLGRAHMKGALYNLGRGYGGVLRLWDSVEVERPDLRTGELKIVMETIPEDCGVMRGWSVLGPNIHLVRDMRLEVERLTHLDNGEDDAAQQWVLDHGESFPDDLRIFRNSIVRAHDARRKTLRHISDLRDFFSPSNFDLLAKFGSDRRNPHPLYASHRNGECRIGETFHNAIRLRPEWVGLDQLPPWPEIVQSES
jgi:hypothetical protein